MNSKKSFASIAILLASVTWGCSQNQEQSQHAANQNQSTQPPRDVKVTQGLVVQQISGTSVLIHWSTNVVTDTLLRYGTHPDRLDQVATEVWAGVTHRVVLKNLTPHTTYYYRVAASSPQATEPMSNAASFRTQTENRAPSK
jgi:acid phosphatase type 7